MKVLEARKHASQRVIIATSLSYLHWGENYLQPTVLPCHVVGFCVGFRLKAEAAGYALPQLETYSD